MAKKRNQVPYSELSTTGKFYRDNLASRKHHSDTNNSAHPKNKFAHSKTYKKVHSAKRREEGIMGKGGPDISKKPNGSYGKENLKINRRRGGAQRA